MRDQTYDYIIIGSGFGGSVSALRLVEKGYKVLVIEQGRRFAPEDYPKSNWDLKRWFWKPALGMRGLFNMEVFRHVSIVHGVGYGGGSLVYANTLPIPNDDFFESESWGHLGKWKDDLAPHYHMARKMLGATENPKLGYVDGLIESVGKDMGRSEHFHPTCVAVYFGQPGKTVPDPYFGGEGPERTGCTRCGGCMLGCRIGAKNTLDKNYLYLAERKGLHALTETKVTTLRPDPEGGYVVDTESSVARFNKKRRRYRAKKVVVSAGVIGSVELLLRMQADSKGLPDLSPRLGDYIRTNSESLIGVVSGDDSRDLSKGIAIGSILHTDEHSHVEPVRYPEGSGFWRSVSAPHVEGRSIAERMINLAKSVAKEPRKLLRTMTVKDYAKQSLILLYMRTLDGTLRFKLNPRGSMSSEPGEGAVPTASIPEATEIANQIADKLDGQAMSVVTETLFNIPTTAHILGGACMGANADEGVIDTNHEVFNYPGLYVIDGAAVSANPGVNPSLTIAALAELAMTKIPEAPRA